MVRIGKCWRDGMFHGSGRLFR
ncbi:hypothetical protein LINPERHAP1_LOCUS43684 [Linum perenne]